MNTKTLLTALVALVIGLGIGWYAAPMMGGMNHDMSQMGGMDHSKMAMGAPKGDQGPSSVAYAKVNADMHAEMDIVFSGNSDRDFAAGMIAHHIGAVEMAKVQLEFGKDAEMRKLAEDIIAAQQPEIDQMSRWLAANP